MSYRFLLFLCHCVLFAELFVRLLPLVICHACVPFAENQNQVQNSGLLLTADQMEMAARLSFPLEE